LLKPPGDQLMQPSGFSIYHTICVRIWILHRILKPTAGSDASITGLRISHSGNPWGYDFATKNPIEFSEVYHTRECVYKLFATQAYTFTVCLNTSILNMHLGQLLSYVTQFCNLQVQNITLYVSAYRFITLDSVSAAWHLWR
jgi:hypothetical protein